MIGKNIAVRKLGVVEVHARSAAGSWIKKQLEVDFVANKGYERYYVQSAYAFSDEEKQAKEKASLFHIPDSFERIIVTGDPGLPYRDENGFRIDNLIHFLLTDF